MASEVGLMLISTDEAVAQQEKLMIKLSSSWLQKTRVYGTRVQQNSFAQRSAHF